MSDEIYTGKKGEGCISEIHRDTHRGLTFKILSIGSHPTAYILIPQTHMLHKAEYDDIDIAVHGGLTYAREIDGEWWIGWDYAHYGDFTFHNIEGLEDSGEKRWTKEEIIKHCKDAIDQIKELKKFRVKKYYYSKEERE